MVSVRSSLSKVVWPLALSGLMMADGCKLDDTGPALSRTDMLLGDWEMSQLGSYSFQHDTYIFGFKGNLDFQICVTYKELGSVYCDPDDEGTWHWADANEEKIMIDHLNEKMAIDIVILDAARLEGEITFDYGGDYPTSSNVRFKKIN